MQPICDYLYFVAALHVIFSWHFLILSPPNTEYTAPKEHGNKSIGRQVRWSRIVLRQVGRCHGGLRFGVHLTRCIAGHQPAWRFD